MQHILPFQGLGAFIASMPTQACASLQPGLKYAALSGLKPIMTAYHEALDWDPRVITAYINSGSFAAPKGRNKIAQAEA
jgi:hypothetical protein